jgi:hypothetical protein
VGIWAKVSAQHMDKLGSFWRTGTQVTVLGSRDKVVACRGPADVGSNRKICMGS